MILKFTVDLDEADAPLATRVINEALAAYILDLNPCYRQLSTDDEANERITSRIAVASMLKKAIANAD